MTEDPPETPEAKIDAILPPDGRGRAPTGRDARDASEIARVMAHWMDEFLRIPGTNIRIGLDPLLGLFPVAGDMLASSAGLIILVEAMRLRVPVSVLARMGINVLLNNLLGNIPVAGDIFSVFFRSNSRNVALLNRWKSGGRAAVKRGSRVILAAVASVILLLAAAWLWLWLTVFSWVVGLFQR